MKIRFLPFSVDIDIPQGMTILEAARLAGVYLPAPCGGRGRCGNCKVRIVSGDVSPGGERDSNTDISVETILACRTRPLSDTVVEIVFNRIAAEKGRFPRGTVEGPIGIAVDLGTTSIVGFLVSLPKGEAVFNLGFSNPQQTYGRDVISRIQFALKGKDGTRKLRETVLSAVNWLIMEICRECGIEGGEIERIVLVGNPAMVHLFMGLPVESLGMAPYEPFHKNDMRLMALEAGISCAPNAILWIPPAVAGFVGPDHLAAMEATGFFRETRLAVLMDIGTNTEISITNGGKIFSCSAASGPAFEGAALTHGLSGVPGAINRVRMRNDEIIFSTIHGELPVGICGSAVVDAVAALHGRGFINGSGGLSRKRDGRIRSSEKGTSFELVPPAMSGHGMGIEIYRKDIQEIQLAKAAIRAGLDVLLSRAMVKEHDIERFIIAGAFGSYINISNAVRIGLVPGIPVSRFCQVGNAAGKGACRLLDPAHERELMEQKGRITYVELAGTGEFNDAFTERVFI